MSLRLIKALCYLLVVPSVLVLPNTATAQTPDDGPTSIGFASPDSTHPIRDYRLPSWRWSQWTLDANGRTDYTEASSPGFNSTRREQTSYGADFSVSPRLRSFWESETRRARVDVSPSLSLNQYSSTTSQNSTTERDNFDLQSRLSGSGTLREYVSDRTFLLADGSLDWSYRRGRRTIDREGATPPDSTSTEIDTDFRADLRLGIGLGRVRVVTPVVRALRVRERLRTAAPGTSLSDEQVQRAARQLARRPGYQAVYDRPDKVFWRDFFDQIDAAERSPFETFYVADVLREPVGVRREGAELQIGPSASYDRSLQRTVEEDQLTDRDFSESRTVGGFVRGQWYRNVTLRHQLGADVRGSYRRYVPNQGSPFHNIVLDLEGQWLWVLADRVRLDTRLSSRLNYQKDSDFRSTFRPSSQYSLSSDLRVFIENSLSLTAGASMRYRYDGAYSGGSSRAFDMGLRFRIQYILSRTLQ